PGVCLSTTDCTAGGGEYWSGYCPNDPANVKCCVKRCPNGICRPVSLCPGKKLANYCPGPESVKCC
ncbi:hypothetical protein BKA70DRAFT_1041814, partial [Coprinopsis sp. MPI-PUGE-AT-0042]